MFSMDTLFQDLDPQHKTPSWQRRLLKTLFREKEFHRFADQYQHLKGIDMVEQVLEQFNIFLLRSLVTSQHVQDFHRLSGSQPEHLG